MSVADTAPRPPTQLVDRSKPPSTAPGEAANAAATSMARAAAASLESATSVEDAVKIVLDVIEDVAF